MTFPAGDGKPKKSWWVVNAPNLDQLVAGMETPEDVQHTLQVLDDLAKDYKRLIPTQKNGIVKFKLLIRMIEIQRELKRGGSRETLG